MRRSGLDTGAHRMTVQENERRIGEIEKAQRHCVSEVVCHERNGRVMDAVDSLKDATRDLTEQIEQVRRERLSDRRTRTATLITVIVAGGAAVLAFLFNNVGGG